VVRAVPLTREVRAELDSAVAVQREKFILLLRRGARRDRLQRWFDDSVGRLRCLRL
jgi:hypothetical protein